MNEVETKVLDIDKKEVETKLLALGAKKVSEALLKIDWFWRQNDTEGNEPWFLRIRTSSTSKSEITWKAKSTHIGISRVHKEMNIEISDAEKMKDLLIEIGLINYAHQEKRRTSYTLKNWRLDIDEYPNMPPFTEIEGESNEHIKEAISLLGLESHKTWNDGERKMIKTTYNLDWFNMKF